MILLMILDYFGFWSTFTIEVNSELFPSVIKMSRIFSLLGDSNIKRHMNPTNCRDRPLMSGCEVLPCGRLSVLAESLKSIRSESNVVILSCLTNFITMSEESGSTASRVAPEKVI